MIIIIDSVVYMSIGIFDWGDVYNTVDNFKVWVGYEISFSD